MGGRGQSRCSLPFASDSGRIAHNSMHPLLYLFPCSAILLEGMLLWRLSKHGLASRYPHLTVFVLYRFLGDAILFPINHYKPDWFAVAYWRLEAITLSLQFLVNWEFLRGLCLGFGIYLLARSMNFASLQVFRGFAPYWRLLTPMTFIAMIAVWLWAFWEYAPSSEQASLDEDQYSQWKTEWQHLWSRT